MVAGPWAMPESGEPETERVSVRARVALAVSGGLFSLAAAGLLVVLLIFDAHRVVSPSMEPAYPAGTRVLSRAVGPGEVGRGDVVLVEPPADVELTGSAVVIRRVVALGGDTVGGARWSAGCERRAGGRGLPGAGHEDGAP
jgi:hypothetical protein